MNTALAPATGDLVSHEDALALLRLLYYANRADMILSPSEMVQLAQHVHELGSRLLPPVGPRDNTWDGPLNNAVRVHLSDLGREAALARRDCLDDDHPMNEMWMFVAALLDVTAGQLVGRLLGAGALGRNDW